MGVRGLKSFVNKFYENQWERRVVRGKLVVDGNSLCHSLYRVDWTNGGQYLEYRLELLEYFRKLQQADICPIVVFDGIDYKQEKTEEAFRRHNKRIRKIDSALKPTSTTRQPEDKGLSILPVFAIEVFQQTLHELEVPLYVVDGEADATIVQIANHYSCPVLSSDSDFFMFNVEGGYIPIERFYCDATVTADVFSVRTFTQQCRFADSNLRLVIPAIVGNDFLSAADSTFLQYVREKAGQQSCTIMAVTNFASQFSSMKCFVEQIALIPPEIDKKGLKRNCERVQEIYLLQRQTVNPDELALSTELRQANGNTIPDLLLQQYRLAKLPVSIMEALVLRKCMLRIVVDNSQSPSSLLISSRLRQHMYQILGIFPVAEIFRRELDLQRETIFVTDNWRLPDVENVKKLDLTERKRVLFTALCCSEEAVEKIDETLKLIAASLMYWATSAEVPIPFVKALISCIVLCYTCTDKLPGLRSGAIITTAFMKDPKRMAALHSFAQWQCVYFDAITLNQLLMEPLRVVSPAFLYDGKIAMHLASVQNIDQTVSQLPIDNTIYDVLLEAALKR